MKVYDVREKEEKNNLGKKGAKSVDVKTVYNKIYLALGQGLPSGCSLDTPLVAASQLIDYKVVDEAYDLRGDIKTLKEAALSVLPKYAQQVIINKIAKDYMTSFKITDFKPMDSTEFTRNETIVNYAQHRGLITKPIESYCHADDIYAKDVVEVLEANRDRIISETLKSDDEEFTQQSREEASLDINNTFSEMISNLPYDLEKYVAEIGITSGSFKRTEDEFYSALRNHDQKRLESLWEKYKGNIELLEWAMKPVKTKYDDTRVKGTAICAMMLANYDEVDKETYQKLISIIYSNRDVARFRFQGDEFRGSFASTPYIILTLQNRDLSLTPGQKTFAVDEALLCYGAINYDEEKSPVEYDRSAFDIRYWILNNENWTSEEKEPLVFEFWEKNHLFDNIIESWQTAIVNDAAGCKQFDISYIFEYTKEDIIEMFGNNERANKIWEDLLFCRAVLRVRPQTHQLSSLANEDISDEYLEILCQKIDNVYKIVGTGIQQRLENMHINSDESIEDNAYCENPGYCARLRKEYKSAYDFNELKKIAKLIAPQYARIQLSIRLAKCILDINKMDDVEIPTEKREKLMGKIFYFANRIGLVSRMLDYYPEVTQEDLEGILRDHCSDEQLGVVREDFLTQGEIYKDLKGLKKSALYGTPKKWL